MKRIGLLFLAMTMSGMGIFADEGLSGFRAQENVVTTTRIREKERRVKPEHHAVPLGNGRQGALVFGNPQEELIVLNELTLWGGGPQEADKTDAHTYLPEIRRLLCSDGEAENKKARPYIDKNFTCIGESTGAWSAKIIDGKKYKMVGKTPFGSFQNLGFLKIHFTNAPDLNSLRNYRRTLDMRTSILAVEYEYDKYRHQREHFVSFPDKVFVSRLTTDDPGGLNFTLALERQERFTTEKGDAETLIMFGQVPDYDPTDDDEGMRYATYVRVVAKGGTVSTTDKEISVKNAAEVLLLQTARTDYAGPDGRRGADPLVSARQQLDAISNVTYDTLRKRHISDYKKLYGRVNFKLGPDHLDLGQRSIEDRMARHAINPADDVSYPALLFNFGRYLLISSCRKGGLPPNLQGIWASEIHPKWNADYHLDINLQMNMWPAELSNLPECHSTLVDYIENNLVPSGRKTAKAYFDVDDGWINFIVSNVWGYTSPLSGGAFSIATSATPWLCQHLWWHYDYNRDTDYLKRVYPILKGAMNAFYKGVLYEHPRTGELVTVPSHSPETGPMCVAATIDSQCLRELMKIVIKSSEILDIDEEYRNEIRQALTRMPKDGITQSGHLMEWYRSETVNKEHRHISHLWGVYPGIEISLDETPQYADAARQSLIDRGHLTTGWAQVHRLACWARLRDKEMFHRQFMCFSKPHQEPVASIYGFELPPESNKPKVEQGRLLPNLLGLHPRPYQIDCNFGVTAGVAEGLMSSYPGKIILLPALPGAWSTGSVTGLKARGNIVVSMQWKNAVLTSCSMASPVKQRLVVVYQGKQKEILLNPDQTTQASFQD